MGFGSDSNGQNQAPQPDSLSTSLNPDDISNLVAYLTAHGHLEVESMTEEGGKKVISCDLTPSGLKLLAKLLDIFDLLSDNEETVRALKP